ncbi:MAG TPA: PEP-utilizing enzyme [Solirubrobacterales bacterium]|jgi:phosphoenolpyruvate synthase/pyruvate phosphate dikinase
MSHSSIPPLPDRVRYALTVPQSVLFADISLRGSRRSAFEKVFGTRYEPDFIIIDDGAMSWDFTGDEAFAKALLGTAEPLAGIRRFIAAMGSTARAVEKTSWLLSAPSNRRESAADLLADLREYWDVYEQHMTSLFTFWNVEELLSEALIQELKAIGRDDDVQGGLQRFLQPSETNYFALERRHFARIASRFGRGSSSGDEGLEAALADHVANFGFLLAPFNLGNPPSVASLRERLEEEATVKSHDGPLMDLRPSVLADLSDRARELGLLAQELTFWKTERLDVMALGDARAASLYKAAADLLSIDTDNLFAMCRDEIDTSLEQGAPIVDDDTRRGRLDGYCLALVQGAIGFYEPSRGAPTAESDGNVGLGSSNELIGTAATTGSVTGRVRVIADLADIEQLKPGDVLVTSMTRPEMGVGLDRAAAFVTDEGGRMSHAAIIAREMGKPCIIGTGEATKVLRDGMVVEVDADAGLVTILSAADGSGG